MNRKKYSTGLEAGLFYKYARSRLLMPLIPGIVPSLVIRLIKSRFGTVAMVPGGNEEKLSGKVF